MPQDTETPQAAVDLAATLAEFDTQPGADTPPADEFLASFDDVLNPSADPPAPSTTEEPPAGTPPPAADPPAAPDPDGIPEELPGKPSEAAKNHWKKLTTAHKQTQSELNAEREARAKEVAERDAELATLRKQVVDLPELSAKAKLAEEAERELAVARVEGTREYKETILAPLDAIEKAAEAIAAKNDLKVDAILDALTESDPEKQSDALEELVSGLREVDKQRIIRMAEDTRQLLTKRDQIRSRAVEARKELEEITSRKETEAAAASRKAFEGEVTRYAGELKNRIPFVKVGEGDTLEGVFASLQEKAMGIDLDKAEPHRKAFAAFASVALPRATQQLVKLMEENTALKARIAEGASARPTVGSPSPAPSVPSKDDGDFLAGFNDILGFQHSRPITEILAD